MALIKYLDEGPQSPFVARLFFGLFELRDVLYLSRPHPDRSAAQTHFDKQFQPMFEAAMAMRDAAIEVSDLVRNHQAAVLDGSAASVGENQFEISQTIDVSMSQAVDKLIDQGAVAIKTGLQSILRDPLGLDVGFLFQTDTNFESGSRRLEEEAQPELAAYLTEVRRAWLSDFMKLRVAHEHQGWSLGATGYVLNDEGSVVVAFPTILDLDVNRFASLHANRALLFIENMMAYAMQRSCRVPIVLVEIPANERDPLFCKRFRLAVAGVDPSPPWVMRFSDDSDFV